MSQDLKPCPFCGSPAELKTIDETGEPSVAWVACTVCDVLMDWNWKTSTVETVVEAWNRRTP